MAHSEVRRSRSTWRGKMAHIAGLSMCCWTMSCITSGVHCSGASPGLPNACSQKSITASRLHRTSDVQCLETRAAAYYKIKWLHEWPHLVVEALSPVRVFLIPGPRGRGVMARRGAHTHVGVVCRVAKLCIRIRGHPLYAQTCTAKQLLLPCAQRLWKSCFTF